MTYCTLNDVESVVPMQELVNLTVDEPSADSTVDTDILNECIESAGSIIDGYLRARYTLPLLSTPKFLTTIASDITAYRLYMRRPQTMPEHIKFNYETALKELLKIKKGDILLETPSENPDMPKIQSGIKTNKTKKDRIFNDKTMRMYRNA
jgi:phage gp36-like protein